MTTFWDRTIVFIMMGAILCSSAGVYLNTYQRSVDIPVVLKSRVGVAREIHNSVRRKFDDSFIWDLILSGDELFHRDTLFIGEDSSLFFHLEDGSVLAIGENSLIVLDHAKQDDQQGGTIEVAEVRLLRGRLSAQRRQSTPAARSAVPAFKVALDHGVKLNLDPGSTVAVSRDDDKLDIVATQGRARIERDSRVPSTDQKMPKIPSVIVDAQAAPVAKKIDLNSLEEVETKLVNVSDSTGTEETEQLQGMMKTLPKDESFEAPSVEAKGKLENFQGETSTILRVATIDSREIAEENINRGKAMDVSEAKILDEEKKAPALLKPEKNYLCVMHNEAKLLSEPDKKAKVVSVIPKSYCTAMLRMTEKDSVGNYWAEVKYRERLAWVHSAFFEALDVLPKPKKVMATPLKSKPHVRPATPQRAPSTAPSVPVSRPTESKPQEEEEAPPPEFFNYFQNR